MVIYTDGACSGNGKAQNNGGFGVIVIENDKVINAYGKKSENTTNNREELKAILWAMLQYGQKTQGEWDLIPIVYSDSAYCVNTFNEWMFNWAKKGWIKSDKKIPENLDLIQAYYDWFNKGYKIDLRKVKGHAGNQWNELADKLATGAMTAEEVMEIYG